MDFPVVVAFKALAAEIAQKISNAGVSLQMILEVVVIVKPFSALVLKSREKFSFKSSPNVTSTMQG